MIECLCVCVFVIFARRVLCTGKPAVMIEAIEGHGKLRERMTLRLQNWTRMLQAQDRVRQLLYAVTEIHFDSAKGREYYWNRRRCAGACGWGGARPVLVCHGWLPCCAVPLSQRPQIVGETPAVGQRGGEKGGPWVGDHQRLRRPHAVLPRPHRPLLVL